MVRRLALCLLAVAVAIIAYPLLAIDTKPAAKRDKSPWPQWRGPNRDGVSSDTGLLKQWPEEGPPLAWTAKGLGAGFAGISIADGISANCGDLGKQESVGYDRVNRSQRCV